MKATKILLILTLIQMPLSGSAQFNLKKKLLGESKKVNVKERAAFSAAEKKLQATLKKVNRHCKLRLTGLFDQKSFAGRLKDHEFKNLAGPACEEALMAFGAICNKKTLRPRIAKVKEYTCSYSAAKSELKLVKNQVLQAAVNPRTANLDKFKVDILSLF